MTGIPRKLAAILLALALLCPSFGQAAARKKTVADWMEGFESGENWFGEGFAYDITDTETCWELLQRPITVLNVGEREVIYPLVEPGGRKVNNDPYGGFIAGSTAAVHVLGPDEGGWTLVEGMDDYDRLIRGYVRTKLLKTVTPNKTYGIIIDKLVQRLYVFIDGELFSSCAISTGLPNGEKPYYETASGEYLISSWVGNFEIEGLMCEKAMRFNNGDLIHQVPYTILGDGTQRFSVFEAKLGQRASHGCVRTARYPNDDGLAIGWLWDNLKKGTKVLVWDDDGRRYPYPADDLALYYNPSGGSRYHLSATCAGVRVRYHPMTPLTYGQLDEGTYRKLEPCDFCTPPKRRGWIDKLNLARGIITRADLEEERDALERENLPEGYHETEGGAIAHTVEIIILD